MDFLGLHLINDIHWEEVVLDIFVGKFVVVYIQGVLLEVIFRITPAVLKVHLDWLSVNLKFSVFSLLYLKTRDFKYIFRFSEKYMCVTTLISYNLQGVDLGWLFNWEL